MNTEANIYVWTKTQTYFSVCAEKIVAVKRPRNASGGGGLGDSWSFNLAHPVGDKRKQAYDDIVLRQFTIPDQVLCVQTRWMCIGTGRLCLTCWKMENTQQWSTIHVSLKKQSICTTNFSSFTNQQQTSKPCFSRSALSLTKMEIAQTKFAAWLLLTFLLRFHVCRFREESKNIEELWQLGLSEATLTPRWDHLTDRDLMT